MSDDGKIVGVNLFVTKGAEGINFAVAAKEIRYFLQNPADGMEAFKVCTQPSVVFEGRNRDNNAFIRMVSLRCDNVADVTFVWPDDKRQPIYAQFYSKRRDKPDGIVSIFGDLVNGMYPIGKMRRPTAPFRGRGYIPMEN